MKSVELWSERIVKPNQANTTLTNQVFACCFLMSKLIFLELDGEILVACVGDAILVYETLKGEMQTPPIRGAHKDTITCIASTKDGQKFATGSLDKTVVIWTYSPNKAAEQIKPESKYTQAEQINCLAFSPLKQQIFSGSSADYAVWQPGAPSIDKYKYKDKIISCAWSADGQTVAFGTITGLVVFTDRIATQLKEVQIPKSGPVWCMEWSPITPEYQISTLTVGAWNNSIYTFDANSQQLGPKVELPFDPLSINYASNGEYYAVSGNKNKVSLYTKSGCFLMDAHTAQDWIWTCKVNSLKMMIACGCNDGEICIQQLQSENVTGIHQERFVQREQLTDVAIHQLISNQKARIKCRDMVKRVAVFKEKVAVLCGPRVLIYSCVLTSEDFMKYKLFKKFSKRLECTHFQLASSNVIVGFEKSLQAFNFNGDLDRAWTFEANISTILQAGGPQKRELVLVGLENGGVYKVFLDNSFPVLVTKLQQTIIQLDVSMTKRRIAILDSNNNLQVIDAVSKEILFGEMGVEAVSFNQLFEDLISYSGKGLLFVKCSSFPALNQKTSGNIVGFKGSKLFLFNGTTVQSIDVQLAASVQKYIEKKDFESALKLACLGVTEQDFRNLGIEALVNGEFDIAKRCFVRNKDYTFMDLIQKYSNQKLEPAVQIQLNAEALCYQGRFQDAGTLLLKAGLADKAVELFTELKRWDDAKDMAKKGDIAYRQQTGQRTDTGRIGTGRLGTAKASKVPVVVVSQEPNTKLQMNKLLKEQAEWTKETGEWKTAAELFVSCQEYKKAIDLYGQNKQVEPLIDICRMIDKQDNLESILLCASYFKKLKHHGGAKEAYLKLNDLNALMGLHIEFEKWNEAFAIGRTNPQLLEMAKVPYADYLLRNDRYEEALKAYKSAGRFDITMKMTKDMAKNCLEEKRYSDASTYLWTLAVDCLSQIRSYSDRNGDDESSYRSYIQYSDQAEVYFAYQKIHNFIEEPFQPLSGNAYLQQIHNAARFIISKGSVSGVKMSYVYYALARTAKQLGSFKTARFAYDKLVEFKIPAEWSEEIDLSSMLIRSKPFTDEEASLPYCQRCKTYCSTISKNCTACLHPFMASFISFATLPLVEFTIEMSRQEMDVILQQDNPKKDLFMAKLNQAIEQQNQTYVPMAIDSTTLASLQPQDVLVLDLSHICPSFTPRYFRNMINDLAVHVCQHCARFFFLDEHEFEYIQKRQCPFCKTPDRQIKQKDVFDV